MQLQHCTYLQVERYLQRSKGVLIALGSTEQHGPNGLIGTDALCPAAMVNRASDELGVLVGPPLCLGVAHFNVNFPGTISLRASTLMMLLDDYLCSLEHHGFEHFYLLNGHGGNIAPIDMVLDEHRARSTTNIRYRLRSWWQYPATDALRQQFYGTWEGMHATPSEVAITQHLHPSKMKRAPKERPRALSAAFMREHAGDKHLDAANHRRAFPDGRVGSDSSLARPEHGRALMDSAVRELCDDYRCFFA